MVGGEAKEWVHSERRGRTVILTIDHPPVNVLSAAVLDQLLARLAEVERDLEVRVVILASAAESAFSAGADIHEMSPMGPAEARVHGARGQSVTRAIERLPLPVIAAVHGACFGGGCEIALACDFIVASDDARFGQPEIGLGVMPGWGGTRRLPRRVGIARARRWILTGEPVPAPRAAEDGLVDRVVPRYALLSACLTLGEELASKPPVALAAAKYALARAIDPGIDDGLAYELDLWARLFGTDDQKRGMQAFLSKQALPATRRADWVRQSAGFPWNEPVPPPSEGKGDKRARRKSP
jgi:enoyl-CoA hydratase